MNINGKSIDISDLTNEKYMHKKVNNLFLSDYQISVLNYYKIDYLKCSSMKELIYLIEEVLDNDEDAEDLEMVSKEISEMDYYNNTNK